MIYRILPLIASSLLLAVTVARVSAAQLVATPRASLVPASITNRPFLAAGSTVLPVDLAARGYAEDELLVSGQASVYETPAVRTSRLPYVTRMLVRRPLDTTQFSGRVIVEVLEAERYDMAPLWGLSYEQFLRSGDVWVGLTLSPAAAATLLKFDSVRYESLNLADPQAACESGSGLAWDVVAQSGALLRSSSRENPLRSYNPRRVILAGFAQGGSYIVTYIHAQHASQRLGDAAPIYDGYLIAAANGAVPLSPCAALPAEEARRMLSSRDVPVVVVKTQSELSSAGSQNRPDSDEPGNVYRQYEIAGAARSGPFPAGQPAEVDLRIAGLAAPADDVCREPRSDFPLGLALNAIWRQFDRLLASGEAMSSVPRIEVGSQGQPLLDAQGNALGGWRLPQIDVPLATYAGRSTSAQSAARAVCELTGSMRRFDAPRLKALYRDRNGYIELFNAAVDKAVEEGRLVAEDAPALKAPAVRTLPAF